MPVKIRYAAELFFEFKKVCCGDVIQKRRICEKKIVVFYAISNEEAFTLAKNRGKSEEYSFEYDGIEIFYSFLGVLELIDLNDEDEDVSWFSYMEKVEPSERIGDLIPTKDELSIFKKMSTKGKIKLL